jgi:hypothetical protein
VGWGVAVMLFLVKNSRWNRKCETVHCQCNSQFFCRQSSGQSLCTFSHSCHKTSQ